jgi:DNA replication protein DnaC
MVKVQGERRPKSRPPSKWKLSDAVGRLGVGRTNIAAGLGMEIVRHSYMVRYITLEDFVRDFRKADQLGKHREMLSYYQSAQLLMCDEMADLPLGTQDANRFIQHS